MTGQNSNKAHRASLAPNNAPGSKLPRFLQNKSGRDRSKSVNEPVQPSAGGPETANSVPNSSSSSVSVSSPIATESSSSTSTSTSKHRTERRSKLKGVLKELKDDRIRDLANNSGAETASEMEDTPIIIEPSLVPSRSRSRADRPLSASSSDSHPSVTYYPVHSSQRLSDVGTRLSGWFSHTFSSSSTDLSLPAILSNAQLSSSPKAKTAGIGLLNAARTGKGRINDAFRYLLDSDATPDKCPDPIWLLGVQHPGYEPPPMPPPQSSPPPTSGRRSSLDMRRSSSLRASTSSSRGATSSPEPSLSQSQSGKNPGAHWPPVFYHDFTSRIWLTYRSHFIPIRDQSLAALEAEIAGQIAQMQASTSPRRWNWPGSGERGWTSDAGWGCMLRTGQSLLANSLVHLHLGRDWRRPPQPVYTADYATYVKILTWFFDSPDPLCPFSVHRMALAGKELGKDVGQWFGPSTAAGAIKTLVNAFPEAGLGVSVAMDSVIYETDVLAASNNSPYLFRPAHGHNNSHSTSNSGPQSRTSTASPSARRHRSQAHQQRQSMLSVWGGRPVLILIGIRLGLEGVNPIYYDSIKMLYTFPQSVGIAGGRPSSSYYFVGSQADSLFYLDPHHARPAVPLRSPPRSNSRNGSRKDEELTLNSVPAEDSSFSSYREVPPGVPATPMQKQTSSSQSSYVSALSSPSSDRGSGKNEGATNGSEEVDPVQLHYCTAYSPNELKTFHCDRVRKMALSGLDPSMLIGFLCRDERDWRDLRERVTEMSKKHKAIFSIQDEPPSWPSDSDDMGLESVSDVDIDLDEFSESPEPHDRDGSNEGHGLKEDSEGDPQPRVRRKREEDTARSDGRQSEDATTEEDPTDPMTPGPFHASVETGFAKKQDSSFGPFEEDLLDDEEWVDPSSPSDFGPHDPEEGIGASLVNIGLGASSITVSASHDESISRDVKSNGKTDKKTPGGSRQRISKSVSTPTDTQEYYPFPVVDDREDEPLDDTDYNLEEPDSGVRTHRPSQIHQSQLYQHQQQKSQQQRNGQRQRTGTAVNGSSGNAGAGAKIRNTRARDGGRTQSGGVKGIVTSDLEDSSDF